MMSKPFQLSASGPFHTHSTTKINTKSHTAPKDQHVHPKYHHTAEFFLKNTYFLSQAKYYEQVQGAAMGSPLAPYCQPVYGIV